MDVISNPPGKTMRLTGALRWWRPDHTTTSPDRLQQEWQNIDTGETEWIDVPVYVAPRPDGGRARGEDGPKNDESPAQPKLNEAISNTNAGRGTGRAGG